ncbi:hypothetical protein WG66_010403 [Moniliophthora roreri]|nr:hypothetical protein WG66_010403 [Moniliophthora roreri]
MLRIMFKISGAMGPATSLLDTRPRFRSFNIPSFAALTMYVLAAITTASCAAPVQLLDASAILAGMPSTGDFDLPQVDTGLLEQIVPASVPRDFEDGVSNRLPKVDGILDMHNTEC